MLLRNKAFIVSEFIQHRPSLLQIRGPLEEEIRELLRRRKVKISQIRSRVKSLDSLQKKVAQPDKNYSSLFDITDALGIRVTTFYEDDVGCVSQMLENHLLVDLIHSTDKGKLLDSDQFGYRSVHYICKFPESYIDYLGRETWERMRFEVQIRTILQNAWAEIEHELGYKSNASIPRLIRRKFSRLAGLLEMVDEEFVEIRQFTEQYKDGLRAEETEDAQLHLDIDSLQGYTHKPIVLKLDQSIADSLAIPLDDSMFFPDYMLRMMLELGISNLEQLKQTIEDNQKLMVCFLDTYFHFTRKAWRFDHKHMDRIYRGYSLLIIGHIKLIRENPLALNQITRVSRFFTSLDYPQQPRKAREIARLFVDTVYQGQRRGAPWRLKPPGVPTDAAPPKMSWLSGREPLPPGELS